MPLEDLSKEQLIHEHIDLRRRIGELEILEAERTRTQMALKESKEWYENLFENSPISLWVEDFSAVKKYLDGLRGNARILDCFPGEPGGPGDGRAYLRD